MSFYKKYLQRKRVLAKETIPSCMVNYIKTGLFLRVRQGFCVSLILYFYVFCSGDNFFEKTSVISNSLGVTVYREPTSVVLNPAVMRYFDRSCFSASYTYLDENVSYNCLSYYDTLFGVDTTVVVSQLYQDNIVVRENITDEGVPTQLRKIFALLSLGYNIHDFYFAGSVKTIYYDIYGTKSNVPVGFDIGCAKKLFEKGSYLRNKLYIFGLVSLSNILGPSIKIGSETEKYNMKLRTSLNLSLSLLPRYNFNKESLLYDTIFLFLDYAGQLHCGIEYRREKFFFRAGCNPRSLKKYSFGVGAKFDSIALDYAFLPFIDFGIHSLSFSYLWGETKQTEKTSVELEDFLQVQRKAYRIVEKYSRDAEQLIKSKNYDSALQLLNKVLPLAKEYTKINELIDICINAKVASLTNQFNSDYTKYISEKDYLSAYDVVLAVCQEIPEQQIAKQMIDDFNKQNLPVGLTLVIVTKKSSFVDNVKNNIKLMIDKKEFEKVEKELVKLQLLSYDDYIQQKNCFETEKMNYVAGLVKKAVEFNNRKNYTNAYIYFYEAYKIAKDKNILLQLEQVKDKFKKPDLYEELYIRKLFYLSCIYFALFEYQQAKQTFFELRAKYPIFDCDVLLESLRKEKVVSIYEILP